MTQEAAVPSPCINVCRMDAVSGLCEGCLRTLDEIAAWSQMADADKRAVWVVLARRRAARPSSALAQRRAPPAGDTP
jgi:uncharacterized protein